MSEKVDLNKKVDELEDAAKKYASKEVNEPQEGHVVMAAKSRTSADDKSRQTNAFRSAVGYAKNIAKV